MVEDWFGTSLGVLGLAVLSALAMYLAVLVLARISGLRSFAEMTSFDFAMTIAVGTVLGSTAISGAIAVPQGIAALATLFGAQYAIAKLRRRSQAFGSAISNVPRLVMAGDEFVEDALEETRLTRIDIYSKLREANVRNFEEVIAVVVETTGDISVIHNEGGEADFDPDLLSGVDCGELDPQTLGGERR